MFVQALILSYPKILAIFVICKINLTGFTIEIVLVQAFVGELLFLGDKKMYTLLQYFAFYAKPLPLGRDYPFRRPDCVASWQINSFFMMFLLYKCQAASNINKRSPPTKDSNCQNSLKFIGK